MGCREGGACRGAVAAGVDRGQHRGGDAGPRREQVQEGAALGEIGHLPVVGRRPDRDHIRQTGGKGDLGGVARVARRGHHGDPRLGETADHVLPRRLGAAVGRTAEAEVDRHDVVGVTQVVDVFETAQHPQLRDVGSGVQDRTHPYREDAGIGSHPAKDRIVAGDHPGDVRTVGTVLGKRRARKRRPGPDPGHQVGSVAAQLDRGTVARPDPVEKARLVHDRTDEAGMRRVDAGVEDRDDLSVAGQPRGVQGRRPDDGSRGVELEGEASRRPHVADDVGASERSPTLLGDVCRDQAQLEEDRGDLHSVLGQRREGTRTRIGELDDDGGRGSVAGHR